MPAREQRRGQPARVLGAGGLPLREGPGAVSLIGAVKRHPVLIALVGLVVAYAVALWLAHRPPSYEGTSEILVTPLPEDGAAARSLPLLWTSQDPTRIVQTAARLVDSTAAARLTAREMGPGWTPARVAGAIAVDPIGQSDVLAVRARASDPSVAARLANVFAEAALEARAAALRPRVDSLRAQLRAELRAQPNSGTSVAVDLAQRISELRAMRGRDPTLSLSRSAEASRDPVGPPSGLLIALTYVAGLVAGVASALVVELLGRARLAHRDRAGPVTVGSALARVPLRRRRRGPPRALSPRAVAVPVAAAACGVAVIVLSTDSPGRVIAGLVLVLVLPGAVLERAVLPRGEPGPERIMVALGTSAIVVALAAIAVDVVRLPLEATVWALVLVTLTGVAATVAYLRGFPERGTTQRLPRVRPTEALLVALSLALIGGALMLGATPLRPPRGTPGSTALWIQANGQRGAAAMARSDEMQRTRYELAVTVDGRKVGASPTFSLDPGQQYRAPVLSALKPGARVEALLYRVDGRPRLYRRAEMTVGSTLPGATAPIQP